ncbi:hypothetical protein ACW9KT_01835 [Hymenobacter sp. HD11105]
MRSIRLFLPLVLLLLLPLEGCKVPDVNPFAQATTQMTAALTLGLDQATTQLALAAKQEMAPEQQAQLQAQHSELRQRAGAIQTLLAALDAYAATLVEVADANAKGQETMKQVADALTVVSSALGPSVSLAVRGAAAAADAVKGHVQTIRTLGTLKRAVQPADAAIQQTAAILKTSFAELARLDSAAADIQQVLIENQNQLVLQSYDDLRQRRALADAIVSYIVRFENVAYQPASPTQQQRLGELLNSIRKMDIGIPVTASVAPDRLRQTLALLKGREAFWLQRAADLNRLQPRYDQVQEQLAALATSASQHRTVFAKSATLTQTWARSHAALKTAVLRESRSVSFQEVMKAAEDLTAFIDKMKDLSKT